MSSKSLLPSPQLAFVEQNGVAVALTHKQTLSLYKKSKQSGISFDILEEVYRRGMLAHEDDQQAFNRVNSFIAEGRAYEMDKDLAEKRGLWDNIHAKRKRIKAGSGEKMRKPGSEGAPTKQDFINSQSEETVIEARKSAWDKMSAAVKKSSGKDLNASDQRAKEAISGLQQSRKDYQAVVDKDKVKKEEYSMGEPQSKNQDDPSSRFIGTDSLTNNFKDDTPGQGKSNTLNIIKRVVSEMHTMCEDCDCEMKEDAKGYKSPSGGLTQKGRDHYNRESGGHLKAPVTTKPSKLKKGSKAANRRKSFCARMGGMKKRLTSAKTANDPDSRINKALRKWNC